MKPTVLRQTRVDFVSLVEQNCPNCQQVLWSRPNAAFICARCYNQSRRLFLFNPINEEVPFDADLITWTNDELAALDLIPVKVPPINNLTSKKHYGRTSVRVED